MVNVEMLCLAITTRLPRRHRPFAQGCVHDTGHRKEVSDWPLPWPALADVPKAHSSPRPRIHTPHNVAPPFLNMRHLVLPHVPGIRPYTWWAHG